MQNSPAKQIAIAYSNIRHTAEAITKAQEKPDLLSSEAMQQLTLIHAGLDIGLAGFESPELRSLIMRGRQELGGDYPF